jgi:hypothetical protein
MSLARPENPWFSVSYSRAFYNSLNQLRITNYESLGAKEIAARAAAIRNS